MRKNCSLEKQFLFLEYLYVMGKKCLNWRRILTRSKRVICMLCNLVVVLSVMWPRRILSRWNMPFLWCKMKDFPYKILCSYLFFNLISLTVNRHFLPTSPLRDYGDSQGNKHRRSRSASVRFVSEADNVDQVQSTNGNRCSK